MCHVIKYALFGLALSLGSKQNWFKGQFRNLCGKRHLSIKYLLNWHLHDVGARLLVGNAKSILGKWSFSKEVRQIQKSLHLCQGDGSDRNMLAE